MRDQVNKLDEAKFCSSVLSTFEVLTLQHAVKHHYIEELGRFCCTASSADVAVFSVSYWVAEQTSQM